jgi:tetratricopeptide (TPR) repeat protein
MRSSSTLRISLLLTLIPIATPVFAQENANVSASTRRSIKIDAPAGVTLEERVKSRARDLAASVAEQALKWDDKQAAVRVLAQACDLLWRGNPEQARAWLTRAWELAEGISEEGTESTIRRFRNTSPQSQARATVLAVAQKYDRPLVDRFLKELADEDKQSRHTARRGVFDDRTLRSEQLLNMALAVVEREPATAADLAERSLSDGISFQLQSLLIQLRLRDEAAASRVFEAAVNRLATGFAHPSEVQILTSYLFTPGRVLGSGGGTMPLAVSTQTPALASTPAESDPALTRRFLSVMQRILLSMPAPATTTTPAQSAREFVALSASLANGFRRYAPDLWPPVELRSAQLMPELAPMMADRHMPVSSRELVNAGHAAGVDEKELNRLYVEGLEEAAEKERDPIARKLAFMQAALATAPEDLERARRLAGKIDEDELRGQLVSFLVYRAALQHLERGRLEESVKLAGEARPVQRAIILITVAQRTTAARGAGSREQALSRRMRALDYLTEAEKVLSRDNTPAALRLRLGLVAALAPLDAQRAFEVFGAAITAINQDGSFDPADNSAPRIVEMAWGAPSLLSGIRSGYGFRDAVTTLARTDFDGVVMAATKLSVPAVRGTCMMEIARSILTTNAGN